ncbi:hypothetical protein OAF97_01830, partial [Akkermansiaceae bacterium]|nr:hypothetical protein [Akkermansiaceae bacterium]
DDSAWFVSGGSGEPKLVRGRLRSFGRPRPLVGRLERRVCGGSPSRWEPRRRGHGGIPERGRLAPRSGWFRIVLGVD